VAQAPGAPPKKADKAGDDGGDAVPDENKFDEFMGADGALLAGTTGEYDKDDREADEVWAQIDEFMDNRRRVCHRPLSDLHGCSSAFLNTFHMLTVFCLMKTHTNGTSCVLFSRTKVPCCCQVGGMHVRWWRRGLQHSPSAMQCRIGGRRS